MQGRDRSSRNLGTIWDPKSVIYRALGTAIVRPFSPLHSVTNTAISKPPAMLGRLNSLLKVIGIPLLSGPCDGPPRVGKIDISHRGP